MSILFICVLLPKTAFSQCAPQWIDELGVTNTPSALAPYAILYLPSGDVLLGGGIGGQINGVANNGIVRYQPETHTFSPCAGGVRSGSSSGTVLSLTLAPNGDVYVGGNFQSAGGVAAAYIARYNPTSNTWSSLGNGPHGPVMDSCIAPNGDLIVSGDFIETDTSFSGPVARYTPATNTWSAIGQPSLLPGPASNVTVTPNGDIYVYYEGEPFVSASEVRRFSAATQVWSFVRGFGVSVGHSMISLSNGDVLISNDGLFPDPNELFPVAGTLRYSPASNSFTAAGPGIGMFSYKFTKMPSGEVVATGFFRSTDGSWQNGAQTYNPTTNSWNAITIGSTTSIAVNTGAAVSPTGDLFVSATKVNGIPVPTRIACYKPSLGGAWELQEGVDAPPTTMLVLPNHDVIVGGRFTQVGGGVLANNIAHFHSDSRTWSALGQGTNDEVKALALLANGDVLVGGAFTSAGGLTVNRVVRYNPATNVWSSAGTGVGGFLVGDGTQVKSFAVLPDGNVVVAGQFSTPGRRIAKFAPATNTWSSIGSVGLSGPAGSTNKVNAVTAHGTDVIVGGSFTAVGGVSCENIARYHSTTNTWSAPAFGTDSEVMSLAASLESHTVMLGGDFATAGGIQAFYTALWHPESSTWASTGAGPGVGVQRVRYVGNGEFYAGGYFTSMLDGTVVGPLARFNVNTLQWSTDIGVAPLEGFSGTASDIATDNEQGVYVCGSFASVYNSAIFQQINAINFAHFGCVSQWSCDSIDFNNDTSLFDPQDIEAFLSVYSEGPCIPSTATCNDIDFNNDTSIFDPCDINSFLVVYSEGPCTPCGN